MIADRNQDTTNQALHALNGQLSDLPVRLQLHHVRTPKARPTPLTVARRLSGKTVLAVFWFDLSSSAKVDIYVARTGQLVARSFATTAEGERFETLALIIRASVSILLRGDPIPNSFPARVAKVRPKAPKVVKVHHRPSDRWRLRLAYSLDAFSATVGASHGLYLSAMVMVHRYVFLGLSYRVLGSIRGETEGATLTLGRHPTGLEAGLQYVRGRWTLAASVTLCLDILTYRVKLSDPTLKHSDIRTGLLVGLIPVVSVTLRLFWRLQAFIAAGAQLNLYSRRYVIKMPNDTERVLLTPWRAQPLGLAGLSVAW